MIKVSGERPVRSTTAPYITDEGETVEISVEYYSSTPAYLKKRMLEAQKADEAYEVKAAKAEKEGKRMPPRVFYVTDELARDLHALPDLADEKGKPFRITVENLDKLDQRNINAIRQAITDDIAGKKSQPES